MLLVAAVVLHSKTNNSVGQCSITVQQYTSTAYPGDVVQDSSTLVLHTPVMSCRTAVH